MCIFTFVGAFLNSVGNTIFNASLMLALPEQNRGAILGFIQAVCSGGMALSAVIYGVLGDVFPLYLIFVIGAAITILPMLYIFLHPRVKEFVLTH
jgi:MFS family permease